MGRCPPSRRPATLLRLDPAHPGSPATTTPASTHGERIELSAKVLANWVAKAANLLQDEFDVSGGTSVRLALPGPLAHGLLGPGVLVGGRDRPARHSRETADPDDLAPDRHRRPRAVAATADPAVLVTLAGLARRPDATTGRVLDEARELATFPDAFTAWDEPDPSAAVSSRDSAPRHTETWWARRAPTAPICSTPTPRPSCAPPRHLGRRAARSS